jgi:hypothetical protein
MLDQEVVVAERILHQPPYIAKAVHQHGRLVLNLTTNALQWYIEQGPTLCESLLSHLSSEVLPMGVTPTTTEKTSGANHQIHPV